MNGERRKGGDKRQREFKQERSTNERTNEPTWSQRGERENARLDSAGERGLLRRKKRQRGREGGRGREEQQENEEWVVRTKKRKKERERGENTGTGKSFPRIKRASRGRHLCQLPVAVSLTFPLFLKRSVARVLFAFR